MDGARAMQRECPRVYSDYEFRRKVARAMAGVRRVLDSTRTFAAPADAPHTYSDKFLLVQLATKAAIVGQLNVLDDIGLTEGKLARLLEWVRGKRAVTLRFSSEERCVFDRTTSRTVESATKYVVERKGFFGFGKKTTKQVTTVTEHFWRFSAAWELSARAGGRSRGEAEGWRQ